MKKMVMSFIVFADVIIFCLTGAIAEEPAKGTINQEQIREIVKDVIKENPRLIYETVNNYVREEQRKKRVEAGFKNRIKDIVSDNSPAKGPKEAPVTIIEYTDFQCPYCRRGAETMHKIMEMYPEKVRLVFKNNPLKFHPQALPAAKAALAANKQGKFWEYHDLLFKNSTRLNKEMYLKLARDLDLDIEKFNKDRNSEEIARQIKDEQAQAARHKLTGTPMFIVNGVVVRGAQPLPYFTMVIDRLLSEVGRGVSGQGRR